MTEKDVGMKRTGRGCRTDRTDRTGDVMTKKEAIEFKGQDREQTEVVSLTSDYCAKKELGSGVDHVNYIDTSSGVEKKVKLKIEIQTFSASRKADLTALAMEKYANDPLKAKEFEDELVLAEALGMSHFDIVSLKTNKPSGVYDSIVYLVNARLGTFGAMTPKMVDDAKNVESQG